MKIRLPIVGEFEVRRKNAVAVSLVKVRRRVRHGGLMRDVGNLVLIEHRVRPVRIQNTSWYLWQASYNMQGEQLLMQKFGNHMREVT